MKTPTKKPVQAVKPTTPLKKKPREDLNQAAARIIREATESER